MGYKVHIEYSGENSALDPKEKQLVIAGQPGYLKQLQFCEVAEKFAGRVSEEVFNDSIKSLSPSMAKPHCCSLWLSQAYIGALPYHASRHDSPCRPHSLAALLSSVMSGQDGCVLIVCERSHMFALGCAVARSFPLYTRKNFLSKQKQSTITVEFCFKGEHTAPPTDEEIACLSVAADGIRLTAQIVDTPCNEMHTDAFLEEVAKVGKELGIEPVVIRGEELEKRGFGGLYGVGKAAVHPPALAILSHTPQGADESENIAWVGKGIVYDTGGLSIKGKTAMPGMKRDCGGAAAILGAFKAAVKQGFKKNLHALFCLAENAVGPLSTRPDDIHLFYSGKTVEINNTDAEGRLALGDGVAYAAKDLKANVVVDMATLTGAQGVATGQYHAAVVTNSEGWEQASVRAGRSSGDLVHPLPYAPELHFQEFSSAVADMKNSVKNRDNAQSSCAGLFIGAHLGFDFPGTWLHFDIAAPVESGERATGFGVALLLTLFGSSSNNPLMNSIAPTKEP